MQLSELWFVRNIVFWNGVIGNKYKDDFGNFCMLMMRLMFCSKGREGDVHVRLETKAPFAFALSRLMRQSRPNCSCVNCT